MTFTLSLRPRVAGASDHRRRRGRRSHEAPL